MWTLGVIELAVIALVDSLWPSFTKRADVFPISWDDLAVAMRWLKGWHVQCVDNNVARLCIFL